MGGETERAREQQRRSAGRCYSDGKAAALAGSVPSPRILYERWRQLDAAPQTGRGAHGRRPGQPIPPPHTAPDRTPGPKRSRPGGAESAADPLLRPPTPPCSQHLSRQLCGGFPRPAAARPCGAGTAKIKGVPPESAGMRSGERGGRARMECGKSSAKKPTRPGAAPAAEPRLPAPPPGCPGLEIGTGEINMLKSLKSGTAARSRERDKPQPGHIRLKITVWIGEKIIKNK